jgi:hypothetical protein
MYQNEEDMYGDELDGDEDRNDGLNALVSHSFIFYLFNLKILLESSMGDGNK